MTCPKCGSETAQGLNYCGGCGAQLKNACPGCDTINPPFFKYCGQCGRNLVDVGSVLLNRAGLILSADATALSVIGQEADTVKGKPFSLFIKVDDLVIFYSHWNELIRSSQLQSIEIELSPSPGTTIHAQIEISLLEDRQGQSPRIHMTISDISDRRLATQDAQALQDLINLIFTWVDDFDPSQENGREKTIGGVLEKVGLFTAAQYGFISRIDLKKKCLVTDFMWRLSPDAEAQPRLPSMPVALMARLFDKLIRDRQFLVNDTGTLSDLERKVLREWHQADLGAIMCHVIYRRKTPIGIIGVATARPTHWSDYAVSLVKLAGRLMAETLPLSRSGLTVIQPWKEPARAEGMAIPEPTEAPPETIDIADIEIIEEPPEAKKPASRKSPRHAGQGSEGAQPPRMKFASDKQPGDDGQKRVFAGDDGKYLMTCPQCGFQDTVSARVFARMGSAVRVQCPNNHRFRIIRELRTIYRKKVQLEGYFAQALHNGNKLASGNVWGPMVVQNLSKSGLKFNCSNAGMLRIGDQLQVRFNLDNANQSLIKKTVIVKTLHAGTVGAKFHGKDRYDATLGFYFL